MMIAIISDVHGNFPALQAVLKEIDKMGCNQILSLGDVSGYYCMVNECINEFRTRRIVNILGNHDYYVLGKGDCPRSYTVNMLTNYQRKVITLENLHYLRSSPAYYDCELFSARHGGWTDPLDEYVTQFDFDKIRAMGVNTFCSGHTHIQCIEKKDGIVYFNPGSVGQPRDGDNRAGFAIVQGNEVQLHRVAYDIDKIANSMKDEGFEKRTYDCLFKGTKIGG